MEENYLEFIPGTEADIHDTSNDLWLIFNNGNILVELNDDKIQLPLTKDVDKYKSVLKHTHYLGKLKDTHCYTGELGSSAEISGGFRFENVRGILDFMDNTMFLLLSRAMQIVAWDKDHIYCSRCGSPMVEKKGERAKQCTSCGFINYPRICPAIIVAVTKGEKLLLAHNKNFKKGFYSVIAGFLDPGETFEQCVKREVMEEVGIKIKNIKYFTNQPWPFPNSLMIAFTAEYDSGEIREDGLEIEHADWFTVEEIPLIPSKATVGGKLINWFIKCQEKTYKK